MNNARVGSVVRRIHVYDGSKKGGEPVGKPLLIMSILDHNPIDGCREKDAIAVLSDGNQEYVWNLHIISY